MEKVAVSLKTCALASITELPTNLEKALRLTVTHGMFSCSRLVLIFNILYATFIMNLHSFFIVLARIDDGSVPQTSAVGHAASMEMGIIKRLMRKDTSSVETVNTALFRYITLHFLAKPEDHYTVSL